MSTRDNAPPPADWVPDCRCGETPCAKSMPRPRCIAEQGDDERDQA